MCAYDDVVRMAHSMCLNVEAANVSFNHLYQYSSGEFEMWYLLVMIAIATWTDFVDRL